MNAKIVKGIFHPGFVGASASTNERKKETQIGMENKKPPSVRRSVVLATNRFDFHFIGISRHTKIENKENF